MKMVCGMALLLAAMGAQASTLDMYYVPSADLEVETPGVTGRGLDTGDGYGVRTELDADRGRFAFLAEYQTQQYDDSKLDIDQWRAGFGVFGRTRNGLILEYVNMELEDSEADGFAGHLRFVSGKARSPQLQTQIGYLRLDDDAEKLTGLEYGVELSVPLDGGSGAFLNYRVTRLEGEDSEVEFTLEDVRLGVRSVF